MPIEVILPRVDMDMTEGMIAAWHVSEGEAVREGAPIFEIETSKATMEIDAPASGVIRHISAPVGMSVPVGTPVAWIYGEGEAMTDMAGARAPGGPGGAGTPPRAVSPPSLLLPPDDRESEPAALSGEAALLSDYARVRATPAARRLARERGVPLQEVAGSGPLGRIGARDVLDEAAGPHTRRGGEPDAGPCLHRLWLRDGRAEPLVLLHGFAAESNSWRPFCHALSRVAAPGLGMLAVDLPAHGKSSAERAGSLDEIVAAVDETLAAEGIDQCHLVGHSFGGAIALATAAYGPLVQVRARSLTLIAPAGLGPDSNAAFIRGITAASRRASFAAWLKLLFADPSQMDDVFVATAEQQLASAEVRARLAELADSFFPDGAQSVDLRGALSALRLPVRLIWGLQDRILPARHADGLPGRIAVHRFTQAGHLPQIEARDDVAAIVAQNIASATTERGASGAR
ncbi:MAG TPA: acetoin dehydrogenase dihydrolipoyllysine-residue acetyltransferase subunit [Paraburkholderia sp.]